MDSLLKIEKLDPCEAEITSPVHLKVLQNNKGNAVFLNSLESVSTVAIVEFLPNGATRGNHYHTNKREIMYVIEGKMRLFYWLPNTQEIKETIIKKGDLVTIEPMLAHAFKAIERTWAVEMGSCPYDPADTSYEERIQ